MMGTRTITGRPTMSDTTDTTIRIRKPMTALRVANLNRSLMFYVDMLGCAIVMRDEEAGAAQIERDGYHVLLAGPNVVDLSSYLHTVRETVRPGATIFFNGGPPDALVQLHQTLKERGLTGAELIERSWGDITLTVPDPDNYTVAFWATVERTPEETLVLYESGPDALDGALAGLSELQIDLRRDADSWSIRQIVHHLTDSEATVLGGTKFALAEPGRLFSGNAYSPDAWADGLNYSERDIDPAVTLFRAIRAHMSQLMCHIPDAWDRATVNPEGERDPAGVMIGMLASHALEHIEEIHEIRCVHGV